MLPDGNLPAQANTRQRAEGRSSGRPVERQDYARALRMAHGGSPGGECRAPASSVDCLGAALTAWPGCGCPPVGIPTRRRREPEPLHRRRLRPGAGGGAPRWPPSAEGGARGRCGIAHGDPHPGRALRRRSARRGAEAGLVFIDPNGLSGDPTCDLGMGFRDRCPEILRGDPATVA